MKKEVEQMPLTEKELPSYSSPHLEALKELDEVVKSTILCGEKEAPVEDKSVKKEKKPEFTGGKFKTINKYYRISTGLLAVTERNAKKGVNTLLLGSTGVGKTELVANLAKLMKLPLTIFDMGTMSDPIMSLVGTHVIKNENGVTTSTFVKSRFSEVIQKPGIVLLDEISRANLTANNLLFPCLDYRRELPMEYCFEDAAPIKIHPECVFFATANLGGQYTGTHKLDRALIDRFMLIEIDPLTTEDIKIAIKNSHPKLDEENISKMVKVYNDINKAHDDYSISFNLSIRHLKLIAAMIEDGFTIYDGFYIICKGLGSNDGLKALESILNTAK